MIASIIIAVGYAVWNTFVFGLFTNWQEVLSGIMLT